MLIREVRPTRFSKFYIHQHFPKILMTTTLALPAQRLFNVLSRSRTMSPRSTNDCPLAPVFSSKLVCPNTQLQLSGYPLVQKNATGRVSQLTPLCCTVRN